VAAFDPERDAILLVAGTSRGGRRRYRRLTEKADKRYKDHLESLLSVTEGMVMQGLVAVDHVLASLHTSSQGKRP
jgi:hypothetical protein